MRTSGILLSFVLILCAAFQQNAKAQTTELLAGNILNGAVTGSLMGLATMGLQNSDDFAPLRVGLGSGILAGAGIAVYDIATLPSGQEFFISATFNDGNNSSIILMLDTLYGAGIGAVLGSAVMLISNKPLLDGLQYGGSAGAWVGFTFGLFDTFVLAERNRDFLSLNTLMDRSSIVKYGNDNLQVGMIQPQLMTYTNLSGSTLTSEIKPFVSLFNLKASF